jgi:pimeloyl-ACP methyl ester carboxylesterase
VRYRICYFLILLTVISYTVRAQKMFSEDRFIKINGISLWVTIHGDGSKPAILFLHGGPGSTMSPYSDALYHSWEKDFLIIQWDQRGAGKTYGFNAPESLSPAYLKTNPLTIDQMTSDGIALAGYLLSYLGKQKLILFGTSWGSVLGVSMAIRRPDLFYAYIGHSQIVDPNVSFPIIYDQVFALAKKTNDQSSIDELVRLGPPPYDTARYYGRLLRVIKKYEKQNSVPAPAWFWNMSKLYDNPKDTKDREDGDDYSFVNYAGDKALGVIPMRQSIHFSETALEFKIPVYLLQGEEDILTSKQFTKPYFDKIHSPYKEYLLMPDAAHGFNQTVLDSQLKALQAIIKNIPGLF